MTTPEVPTPPAPKYDEPDTTDPLLPVLSKLLMDRVKEEFFKQPQPVPDDG